MYPEVFNVFFLKSIKYKFIESLCKKVEGVIHALNSCDMPVTERQEGWKRNCASELFRHGLGEKEKKDKDMDVNRSRCLQK